MRSIGKRLTYANVMATLAFFFALAGGTFAAVSGIPGKDGQINGCFDKKTGDLRVVKQGKKCKRQEQALNWNQKGAKGATGSQGANGLNGQDGNNGNNGTGGSISGVAAGGDLSGTYPNPSIAPGVVGPSELGAIPAVRVQNAQTPINPSTLTILSFNTQEFDTDNMFDTGTPNRLTANTDGVYLLTATVDWSSLAGADGNREIYISLNGSTLLVRKVEAGIAGTDVEQNISTTVRLVAGDYVRLVANQTSAGPLAINQFAQETPVFGMTWLAPAP